MITLKNAPADKMKITSFYGYRVHPITHVKAFHRGIDIGASGFALCVYKGTVVQNYYNSVRGYVVVIDHGKDAQGNNIKTLYQHLNGRGRPVDTRIGPGEHVGIIGTSGASTGTHLHFEVWVNNKPVDPLPYIASLASQDINTSQPISILNAQYVLEVKRLQEHLKYMGLYNGNIDLRFGTKTEEAVKWMQKIFHLAQDGVIGPKTIAKMQENGYRV